MKDNRNSYGENEMNGMAKAAEMKGRSEKKK